MYEMNYQGSREVQLILTIASAAENTGSELSLPAMMTWGDKSVATRCERMGANLSLRVAKRGGGAKIAPPLVLMTG